MSPQQDADTHHPPSRQRSNTTSFPSFNWRRPRPEAQPSPATPPAQALPLEALIQTLTPPAVPSLGHARSLASVLASHTPLPKPASLNPVLASLCAFEGPLSIQATGYEILSAYWENNEAVALGTADRLTYFSLFLGPSIPWSHELWEPRFRALRALTKYGTEVVGAESAFLNVLKAWIQGAFEGLLVMGFPLDQAAQRAERERSFEVLAAFLTAVVENPEFVARIPDEEVSGVLLFYARLVDRAIVAFSTSQTRGQSLPPSPLDSVPSNAGTPSRPTHSHRRNHSSLSMTSISQLNPSPPITPSKHPADLAVVVYLNHLTSLIKTTSPNNLDTILPLLFRSLAFHATPLPRLSITSHTQELTHLEHRIAETLDNLLSGPFTTTCIRVLKLHLFPPTHRNENLGKSIQTSAGAQRTLRNYIRKSLCIRLARAYISRETSVHYAPSGAPGYLDMERDLMERAWPKDEVSMWDSSKLGRVLCKSVEAWVVFNFDADSNGHSPGRERILEEAAGTLKDILQEIDSREEPTMDDEEASAVGATLRSLASYVLPLKNQDGTSYIVPLSDPTSAPTPFLRMLSSLLARDHVTYLDPPLSTTLLSIADHLTDVDTAKLPLVMSEQHDLSPTSPEWLRNWEAFLANSPLLNHCRPLTRQAAMQSLQSTYDSVKDMPGYRKPLADLVFQFCQRQMEYGDEDDEVMWGILGDEVVLCTAEAQEGGLEEMDNTVEKMITLLATASGEYEVDDDDSASITTADTHSQPPAPTPPSTATSSATPSPNLSRTQTEPAMPSVMSILSSLTTGTPSRSQSMHPQSQEDPPLETSQTPVPEIIPLPRAVCAVSALVAVFSQLSFTPLVLSEANLQLAVRVYEILLNTLVAEGSARARLAILQFFMRLRADRDHRVYFADTGYDHDGHIANLASLIDRLGEGSKPGGRSEDISGDNSDLRRARARIPHERDSRHASRARGAGPLTTKSSRSRSRVSAILHSKFSTPPPKPREPMWNYPETLPFVVSEVDGPSEGLISYDPLGPGLGIVLPVSAYLSIIIGILEKEKNWEILSYVLCHLPTQLANKHLFCGPKSREIISKLFITLSTGILEGQLASGIERWPLGFKPRDAQGLAYHTLSVLVGYKRSFDVKLRHVLVEVFQVGLNGQPSTIKCCLHALSLAAFELPKSTTKALSRILEKLSQIMSNPEMAVHILGFLSIVASLPALHANFTEGDFKMVFGVALQYLQHHNQPGSSPTGSWALSQYVRIISYYVVYAWFLAIRLPDRPHHIPFITRQLLLANEGRDAIDDSTEVCFDWLARYTYASADPRPAPSLLSDVVMNPTVQGLSSDLALNEKSWIRGNAVVTVRTMSRLGWIEVLSRRPSGLTKFLGRIENVPMVGPGDVDPDMLSIPASVIMERDLPTAQAPDCPELPAESQTVVSGILKVSEDTAEPPPRPDPITGYVWSGTAPSQRRKQVALDPAFMALQMSSYPDLVRPPKSRPVVDQSTLPAFFRTLDRMPVIDTHKVGILYVAPGQMKEQEILRNTHGSPAYTRFLEGIGRLINLRGQVDVYAGGLVPDEDGEYAYAWWDDIGQILYHTATMMPSREGDEHSISKKRHIGNDFVRIVWNDSGMPYRFDTLATQFQFVNIVLEPHSLGAIAAFSDNIHENEYFKVTVQRAPGMPEFTPIGDFKLISADNLPLLARQLSLLADWFASVWQHTDNDTKRIEMTTNWQARLQAIRRFRNQIPAPDVSDTAEGVMGQEALRDFTTGF